MGRTPAFAFAMMAVISCSDAFAPGQPCFESNECGIAQCIQTSTGKQCMVPCAADDILCELNDEACVAAGSNSDPETSDLFVCLPGGDIPLGSGCTASIDCTVGAICIENGEDTECAQLCSVSSGAPCNAAQVCTALEGDRGFCADPP